MNYLSCNVVHYKRVRVLQWTQFKKNLKERATIKEREMKNKLHARDPQQLRGPTF